MELNLNKKDGALPSAAEIQIARNLFPNSENPMESYETWKSSGMPIETTQKYGRARGPSYPRPERPAYEFTINPNYGVLGSPDLRIKVPKYKYTPETILEAPKQEADRRSLLYGLKTLPLYFSKFTEPIAIGVDLVEGALTRDPLQTGMAGFLSRSMSPKYQKLIAAGSAFMPFDAEAVKIVGSPGLFSAVVEKIKGAPSKARGEEVKQKPENWMGGMLKGGSTLKVNNMEIPIKTSEVENMMRLIKNNKLDDKLLTRDEMVKILEDQYYTSFISEKTSPAYFNRLGNMETTKIELPKDGNVPRDLLEIANYLTRDAGVHHGGEQGIISHSLIRKDNNAYEITEIQSDMASDAHKFGIFGSPKNNMYQELKQSYKDMRGREKNKHLDLIPAGGNLNLPNLDAIFLPSKRDEIIKKYGAGDAVGGGNAVDSYAAAIFDRYKGALQEVDSLYTDEYLGKLYDLSTDKLFKNKYEKDEFIDLTRKNMKDRIVNSLDSGEPNGANVLEMLDMTARGYTTSPRSLYSSVYNALQKKVNDLYPTYNRDDYNTLGFNAPQDEVYDAFIKMEQGVKDFDTLSKANPINQGSVPAQTPLMKNLDYVEFEIKKHLEKAANEDQPRFILPGEEPVRYWSNRGQNKQFLNTIYSLVPDSKKGYKGKIGQVLTKLSKKYNIPFRLDGKVDLDNNNLVEIFKDERNNLENLADLTDATSGTLQGPMRTLETSPYETILFDATRKQTDRIRNLRKDYADNVATEPDDFAQAESRFNAEVFNDPKDFIFKSDMLNIIDWDGAVEGFELMAKNTESKSVRLASEIFSDITEQTRENYDAALRALSRDDGTVEELTERTDVNNLEDLFNISLIQASRKAEKEVIDNLSKAKKEELTQLGIIGLDQNAKFVVELPDVIKEQIIEQGFPITGL
jgi:hypothetical protein